VLALGASAVLLVDYVKPAPVFCAPDGGCGLVRQSALAYPFGIPLPFIGLWGMLAVSISGLWPGRRAQRLHLLLAAAGALVGGSLLGVQLWLGTLCRYCIVVDVASLVIAVCALLRLRAGPQALLPPRTLALAGSALTLAVVSPLAVGMLRKPALPAVVAAEVERSGPGRATVVDFMDFECPYCRKTHEALVPLLAQRRDQVRVVRKQVPLGGHAHAMHAARAACCAEALGQGDEMADALFAAAPSALSPEGCERIAESRGLDLARFRACVRDPATDARIRADTEAFRASHGRGLPTLWIGAQRLEGMQDRESLRQALDEALRAL
jgi:protein-disulfide isomerase